MHAQAEQLRLQMVALRNSGRLAEAVEVCRQMTRLFPSSAPLFANLGSLLFDLGDNDGAVDAARHAIRLAPAFQGAHVVLAAALCERGDAAGSIRHYNLAIHSAPSDPKLLSVRIYSLEFLPGVSPAELLVEQREWDRRFGGGVTLFPTGRSGGQKAGQKRDGKKIKVGYVSAFFFHHAEAFFVLPLLESHDRSRFEIHCYSDVQAPDDITHRHRRAVDHWHECQHLSNDELAGQIRGDGIDILVDLMMHMGRNRAPVFARKPAPVQIAWLAYPGGTGLDAMDFRITDSVIDPPGTDSFYSEKSLRLPHCWCCYDPLCEAPPLRSRPDRPVTFGSLNNQRKLNNPSIFLWALAMHAAPDSRMIILSSSSHQRHQILQTFAAQGISAGRIQFVGRMPREDYLRHYDLIDIALDPLPYAGITTTCDALWMGVPVVTLAGDTAAGRASASIVTAAGLGELVAGDVGQFIDTVAQLANNLGRLNEIRSTLRERCTRSRLMSKMAFARDFESALVSAMG